MAEDFRDACRLAREDEAVRVVVVTGVGPVFSVGRETPPAELNDASADALGEWLRQLQVAPSLAALPMPVIASINGDAMDHGLELALAADLRIASAEAKFGFTGLGQPGRFPADGGTQRLPRLVGPAWAMDLLLTGRVVPAAQALDIGLVNRVAPPEQLAQVGTDLAEQIAAAAPVAARYAKEAVADGLDLGLAQGLRLEADLNVLLQTTEDRAEGLKSFSEKRPPTFRGR
jgi:enoyl-CoA hydratase/carnithine racemase